MNTKIIKCEKCDVEYHVDLVTDKCSRCKCPKMFIVATQPIATSTQVYGLGTIFIVAKNDQAQGGYHAHMCDADLDQENEFMIDYEPGELPVSNTDFTFIPAISVSEESDTFKAIQLASSFASEPLPYHA